MNTELLKATDVEVTSQYWEWTSLGFEMPKIEEQGSNRYWVVRGAGETKNKQRWLSDVEAENKNEGLPGMTTWQVMEGVWYAKPV